MTMNRRNVLIGLGTVAAGGGAALGTGAFSQVEAERTVNIDVNGDASAAVELTANTSVRGVTQDGSGANNELSIELTNVNDGALTSIGVVDDINDPSSVNTQAFTVGNGTSSEYNIDVNDATDLQFWAEIDTGGSAQDISSNTLTVGPDETYNVAVIIDTDDDADDTGDFNSSVTFSATRS